MGCLVVGSLWALPATAFPGLDDQTVGMEHLRSRGRSGVSSEAGAGYYDGRIQTSPPDSSHSDRRLESFLRLGFDQPMSSGLLRFRLQGNGVLRTEEDSLEPKIYIDERTVVARGSIDASFQLQNNLELFGGAVAAVFPGHTRVTSTSIGKSKRTYEAATLLNPRGGVAKRGGDWAAGAYFSAAAERTKAFTEQVFDGTSISGSEVVAQPTRIGAFGGSPVGPLKVEGEFAVIQGSGVGAKDPTGRRVNDDSFAMQVTGEFPLFASTRGRLGIFHQTLSYSDQAFMSLDNIPATAFRGETFVQEGSFRGSAALIYGFGTDDQSQPEFNAGYSYRAVGAVAAVQVAF